MNMESIIKKDTALKSKDEIIALLENQKKIAAEENPACAGGGCGRMCGTNLCSKKIQGTINKINKTL